MNFSSKKTKICIGIVCWILILIGIFLSNRKIYKSNMNMIFTNQLNKICEVAAKKVFVENGYFSIDTKEATNFSKEKLNDFYEANKEIISKNCTIKKVEFINETKQKGYLKLTIEPKGFKKFAVGKTFILKSNDYCISNDLVYIKMNKQNNLYENIKEKESIMLPGGKIGIVRKIEKDTFLLEMLKSDMDYMQKVQIG